MPNKVVPFIVEGPSDECVVDAFDGVLSEARVHFLGCRNPKEFTEQGLVL